MSWEELARFCFSQYGTYVNWEQRCFICPQCGHFIYEKDFDSNIDLMIGVCYNCGTPLINF